MSVTVWVHDEHVRGCYLSPRLNIKIMVTISSTLIPITILASNPKYTHATPPTHCGRVGTYAGIQQGPQHGRHSV